MHELENHYPGGDTNGDGDLTTPDSGDWDGILFEGSWLTGSNILFDNH